MTQCPIKIDVPSFVHVLTALPYALFAPGTRSFGGDGRDLRAAGWRVRQRPLTFINQPMVRNLAKNISVW